ncbi:galactoside alpha-(1,2)-fucosyltransferase 1-like [Penaeus japonicus]|uniref:galactoside alpha-(1,2)-fucosyltransferase 1-like n=1 Tax=Penaeus japonicus TaxID=27405 RepID=UPI001C70B284|nr:galactoside alpha-(1,2)-fucosyltransferase 1-like [Penaeus japonicus]
MGRYVLPKKIFFCAMMLVTIYVFFHDKLHLPAPDIFQLHGKSTATQSVKQIKDEKSHLVPPTSIPPSRRVRFVNHSWHGYPLPLITCQPKGRLGNIMGEYATLWGLRRIYNVTALVSQGMKKSLKMFPALSLPSLEVRSQMTGSREEWRKVGRSGGSLYNFSLIEAASAGLLGPHLFQIQNSPFEMHLFSQFQDDLRREFAFSKQIQDQVRRNL